MYCGRASSCTSNNQPRTTHSPEHVRSIVFVVISIFIYIQRTCSYCRMKDPSLDYSYHDFLRLIFNVCYGEILKHWLYWYSVSTATRPCLCCCGWVGWSCWWLEGRTGTRKPPSTHYVDRPMGQYYGIFCETFFSNNLLCIFAVPVVGHPNKSRGRKVLRKFYQIHIDQPLDVVFYILLFSFIA